MACISRWSPTRQASATLAPLEGLPALQRRAVPDWRNGHPKADPPAEPAKKARKPRKRA